MVLIFFLFFSPGFIYLLGFFRFWDTGVALSPWLLGPWLSATPNRFFLGWGDGRICHQRILNPVFFQLFLTPGGEKKKGTFRVWSRMKILNFRHLGGKNSQIVGGDPKKLKGEATSPRSEQPRGKKIGNSRGKIGFGNGKNP